MEAMWISLIRGKASKKKKNSREEDRESLQNSSNFFLPFKIYTIEALYRHMIELSYHYSQPFDHITDSVSILQVFQPLLDFLRGSSSYKFAIILFLASLASINRPVDFISSSIARVWLDNKPNFLQASSKF